MALKARSEKLRHKNEWIAGIQMINDMVGGNGLEPMTLPAFLIN
jgi:hypothetical protein